MVKALDARSAAHEIRGRMQQPSAEDQHVEAFIGKVLDELGMEHTMNNAAMVARALHDADIRPHQIDDYPKAVTVKVVDKKKYGDEDEHDVVHVVQDEDEEQRVLNGEPPGPARQSEYPKAIRVRGTDGNYRTQLARDLKEERELLGVGASAIDPEASTQVGVGASAIDPEASTQVGGGTNLDNPPDEPEDAGYDEPVEEPLPVAAAPPPPAPRGPRLPPKRA